MTEKLAIAWINHVREMSAFALATSLTIGAQQTKIILEVNSALEDAIQQEPLTKDQE